MKAIEIDTIRTAIRLIASGDTLSARKILSQLTMATNERSPMVRAKPIKACHLCERTIESRDAGANWIIPSGRKYAAMPAHSGCVTKAEIERDRIWAELDAKRSSVVLTIAELDTCACGHSSQHHEKDSLENLLACDMPGCDCDHFHYQTESEPISAAAGR